MAISPFDFQARYKNLSGSGIPPKKTPADRFAFAGIHCDRYVMTNNKEFNDAQPELDKIISNAAGRVLSALEKQAVFNVRYGKGSPDEMQTVLQLAVETGAAKPTVDELQKYADKALGVDCTGFACSYYEQFDGSLVNTKTNNGCGYFYQSYKSKQLPIVWAGDYAEAGDCMLWMHADGKESRKPGHIAIIAMTAGADLEAVQSGSTKSGGPCRSKHKIEEIVHRTIQTGKDGKGKFEEAFYLRLAETDPISGTKAEVIIVRPYYVV